jgi:predicted ferric reductase
MYQPPPLPLLHRNVPDVYTTLVILSLLALNLFYLFFHLDFSRPVAVSILADRAGLLFVANLPWLYVLAAKNQPLKGLTGDSYETLNIFHRRLGEWMCWLAGVHFVGMMGAWYFALRPAGWGLWRFLTIPDVMLGVGAWMAYEGLYLTSLSSFRERCYEAFLASHVFLQAAALVLLWLHHPRSRPYVGVSLAIFSMDRLVWRLGIKSTTTTVDLRVMRDGETVLVSGNWPLPSRGKTLWRRIWGQNMSHGFQPSQHVFITVPAISKGHKFQAHPMTIASAAPGETNHAWFNLIIRAKAGFSRDLLDFAQTHDHTRVHLDGPYGSLHALEMLRSRDRAVIVAGGSGITVAYPMLWDLLRRTGGRQQVCLVWIVQDTSHVSWLGIERLQELRDSGCVVIIPPPSRTHGRPDVTGLLEDAIDSLVGRGDDDVGVVVSGPDGLNRNVNNACASMVGRGRIVECAIEKFGW